MDKGDGMANYIHYHPRYINGRPRNEPIKLTEDELQAMASALKTERRADGLTRKERRAALVAERKAVQDAVGKRNKRK